MPDEGGMSREFHLAFCQRLAGRFRQSTHRYGYQCNLYTCRCSGRSCSTVDRKFFNMAGSSRPGRRPDYFVWPAYTIEFSQSLEPQPPFASPAMRALRHCDSAQSSASCHTALGASLDRGGVKRHLSSLPARSPIKMRGVRY